MIFEIGKYYEHTTGRQLAILGELETTMFGKCLIAEQNDGPNFISVGRDSTSADNYHEISKEKWMKNFSELP